MFDLQEVSRHFVSGRGHVSALHDISFAVDCGQAVVLTGRSGSGKTTLLNCIGTLDLPDAGASSN